MSTLHITLWEPGEIIMLETNIRANTPSPQCVRKGWAYFQELIVYVPFCIQYVVYIYPWVCILLMCQKLLVLQILILLTETAKLGYTCKLCTCLHPVKTTSLFFPCSGHSHAWIYIYIARISSKSSESITLITSHLDSWAHEWKTRNVSFFIHRHT